MTTNKIRLTARGRRSSAWSFALLASFLVAPACADDTEEYFDYNELACEPGTEVPCACEEGAGRGVAVCLGDGSGYSACERCSGPGTCTTFPNCDGCVSPIDICLCQSSRRNPEACSTRVDDPGAGGGGGMAGGAPSGGGPPPNGGGGMAGGGPSGGG